MTKTYNMILLAVEILAFFGMETYSYYVAGYSALQSWIVGAIACMVSRFVLIDILDYCISKEEAQ